MKNLALLMLLLSVWMSGGAQSTVSGIVYEDKNGNGKKDRNEKGIAGVAVSNERDVTLTDDKGVYTLPVEKGNIIFLIKPSGYHTAVNDKNQPLFYYMHKPKGSPDFKFKGVQPTGKLPESVDFGLSKKEESDEFTALIFGDPQPYTLEEIRFFARGIVSEVEGIENVPFGLSLGDLVGDDLDLFRPYIDAVSKAGIPWYNLLGNHDLNFDAEADSLSDETYEAHFGPANYAFNYGKVHFVILDDVLYPDPRDGKGYWGGFREDQFDFIKNDLKHVPKDHLVVLAFHIPLEETGGDTFREEDRQRLFDLLDEFPHTLSLSAHTHLQRQLFFGKDEGWRQEKPHHHYNVGTTSGDWYSGQINGNGVPYSTMRDGTPRGYAFIHFDGNEYRTSYKVAGKSVDYQMEIFAPKVVPHNKRTSASVFVNFFMGAPTDSVMYRVDDGEWSKMHYIEEYDPAYLHELHEWDFAETLFPGRRPSNPVKCTHLWRGRIFTDLKPGEHTMEVKAKDMFGKTYSQSRVYRIEAPAVVE